MSSGTNQERLQQNNQELEDIKTIVNAIPDTNDATAKSSDILEGKTAYMKGRKVTGTLETTYRTIDGGPHTLIEGTFNSTNAVRAIAMSYKFGIALVRNSAVQKTTTLYLATINKETGAYTRTNYTITATGLVSAATSHAFVGADIAQQLNGDGTIRMAFALSDLSTGVYSKDCYIVACDYNLETHSIAKIYKIGTGAAIDSNYFTPPCNPIYISFSPVDSSVFVAINAFNESALINPNYGCLCCFVQSNGSILPKSCLTDGNSSINFSERIHFAWSPNGKHIFLNVQNLRSSSQYQYNTCSIADINYTSKSTSLTKFRQLNYGHMIFLNDNTLFELLYTKKYNVYTRSGSTLTKIKSGTINMNIYTSSGSSTTESTSVSELHCVGNTIYYVDSQYFYAITLDSNFNVTNVEQLDSKYCCMVNTDNSSPYLFRQFLITKVEEDKYIQCSNKEPYFIVFDSTGTEKISTIVREDVTFYNPELMTATSDNLLLNKTAVGNTGEITGSMPNNGELTYTPSTSAQTIPAGYTSGGTIDAVTSSIDNNIQPENIKKDVEVLGVTGTYEGDIPSNCGTYSMGTALFSLENCDVKSLIETIPNINLSGLTNTAKFFINCTNLVSVPDLDLNNSTNTYSMFDNCWNLVSVGHIGLAQGANAQSMFWNCRSLSNIENINLSNANSVQSVFDECYSITNIDTLDIQRAVQSYTALTDCVHLTTINKLYANNSVNAARFFYNCFNLTDINYANFYYVSDFRQFFGDCYSLKNIGEIVTHNLVNTRAMFDNCWNLVDAPALNTNNVFFMQNMFFNCTNLVNVPQYNTIKCNNIEGFCFACNNLSGASIQNIVNMCLNSNVNSSRKNMSVTNTYSPFYGTNITNTRYSNRLSELTAAGWSY